MKIVLSNVLEIREQGRRKYGTMKAFAAALGISPQNLNSYLKGERGVGGKFLDRLESIGFDTTLIRKSNVLLNNTNPGSQSDSNAVAISIDVAGAAELTRTQMQRLARLIHVDPNEILAWELGQESPALDQLAALFNQVVALGLARCAADREARVAAQHNDPMQHQATG